jgi:hypothetical protein
MQIPQATLPTINATGARGFLQWLRADQPGLYMRVLPVLASSTPQLWSDAMQTSATTNLGRMTRALSGLGQDDDDDDDDSGDDDSFIEPVSIDTSDLQVSVPDITADTANTGSIDPSTTGSVSSVIGTALGGAANQSLASTILGVVDGQLQNAAAGLPPSSASTSGIGQAFSSVASSSTALWLIGGGVALVVLALAMGS